MITGTNALRTAENVSGSANMKMGADAIGTAENQFERAKYENGSRRPRYSQQRVEAHKT
jgi:hypothetical protein